MIDWNKINGGFLAPDYIPFEERNKNEMINELNCEVDRLNNIINELEKYLEKHSKIDYECSATIIHEQMACASVLYKLKELKESGNNE